MPSTKTSPSAFTRLRTTASQAITAVTTPNDASDDAPTGSTTSTDNGGQTVSNLSVMRDLDTAPPTSDQTMAASAAADAQVPDGGYGWVVVASCAMLTFWFGGTTYSWGIMQAALVNQGLASASTLALVGM
jgi:hypothetical protein